MKGTCIAVIWRQPKITFLVVSFPYIYARTGDARFHFPVETSLIRGLSSPITPHGAREMRYSLSPSVRTYPLQRVLEAPNHCDRVASFQYERTFSIRVRTGATDIVQYAWNSIFPRNMSRRRGVARLPRYMSAMSVVRQSDHLKLMKECECKAYARYTDIARCACDNPDPSSLCHYYVHRISRVGLGQMV
jgi:hypothetical protein